MTPGLTCADAAVIVMGETYAGHYPGGILTQWWVVPPVMAAGPYRVILTGTDGTLNVRFTWAQFPCLHGSPQSSGPVSLGCIGVNNPVGPPNTALYVWVGNSVASFPPSDYTLRVEPGSC